MATFLRQDDVPLGGCCTYVDHSGACACPEHPVSSLHPFGTADAVARYEGPRDRGAAVRITGGPWPERIGCTGRIVEASVGYTTYPFDKPNHGWVIVMLDDDPLDCAKRGCDHADDKLFTCTRHGEGPAWSCNLQRRDVELI